ncbi:MAG: hypothetical protein SGJ20_22140 [Planctomycetota bacterium]|nr:hypothetical protein [Planctomycetota bacterium]
MYKIAFFSLFLFSAAPVFAQEKAPPITIDEFYERGLLGALGLPFGTVCEIEAVVLDGEVVYARMKSAPDFVLEVQAVNGKKLDKPRQIKYSAAVAGKNESAIFPEDYFELYQAIHRKKTNTINEAIQADLKKRFIGSRHRLSVYEDGGYSGLVAGVDYDLMIAHTGYHFRHGLVVLKRLPAKEAKGEQKPAPKK